MSRLLDARLQDKDAERVRLSHAQAIREIDARPRLVVIKNIPLPDSTRVPVPHRLGRAPSWIGPSAIRGAAAAGVIGEFRDGVDRTKLVEIAASGYGATITIDLLLVVE